MVAVRAWVHQRLSEFLGRSVEYDLSPYGATLAAINEREPGLRGLSDAQLAERTLELRGCMESGADPSLTTADFFALVREAERRALGQRPFKVQILAGLAMHRGRVAELATGEGKTLAAVPPAYLYALSGRGVHVLTFNDYLARRDARWMGPVYERLRLSVGYIQAGMTPADPGHAHR